MLLLPVRTNSARLEVLIALLNSSWRHRHYLQDVLAAPAAALGRVRALFNQVVLQLLRVLTDPETSCQVRQKTLYIASACPKEP